MKIIVTERKISVDGLNSRLVNLERISEMENQLEELVKIQCRERKKDGNVKERLRYTKDRVKRI